MSTLALLSQIRLRNSHRVCVGAIGRVWLDEVVAHVRQRVSEALTPDASHFTVSEHELDELLEGIAVDAP